MRDDVLDIGPVRRGDLVDRDGRAYLNVRKELSPRFGVVWAQLCAGHLALLATVVALVLSDDAVHGIVPTAALALIGGAVIGYWLHYLLLFQHEGVHFNLARTATANDRITNALIGSLIGDDVRAYRKVHMAHHRYLGTPQDTERTYFDHLDTRFVIEALTGVRLVRSLRVRQQLVEGTGSEERSRYLRPMLLIAAAVNGAMVLGAWYTGHPALAAAWVLGSLAFLPAYNFVRQLLEHRSERADPAIDYTSVAHGPVNRLFGSGVFTSTFGAAGFNRHLLHHWDPGVPCTRLADLERYLSGTDVGVTLDRRRMSYFDAARSLRRRTGRPAELPVDR